VDHNFREDLFYRLHVYPVYVPGLGERQEDIAVLAKQFLDIYVRKQAKRCDKFHEEVIDFIKQRPWRGNIRELENFVERLVTLSPEEVSVIDVGSFPEDLKQEFAEFQAKMADNKKPVQLKEKVQEFEADLIKQTLMDCNWNQSEAARRLNTSEKNIRYKIEKLNISKP
jgi:DNA-binding NtrC family response regulator